MPTVQDFDREVTKCKEFRKTARYSIKPPPCAEVVAQKLGATRDQLVKQETIVKQAAKKKPDNSGTTLTPISTSSSVPTGGGASKPPVKEEEGGGGKEEKTVVFQKIILWLGVAAMVYIGYRLAFKKN